jgi:hypothetical protein
VVAGTSYRYQMTALNDYGEGISSSYIEIVASQVPDAITSEPTTQLVGANLKISWTASPNNRNQPVTAYRIKIYSEQHSMFKTTTSCDGTISGVVSLQSCSVPMTILTADPFMITMNNLIKVQVEAFNANGYSSTSPTNTAGVLAKKVP